jgi:hypothetical protein
MTAPSPNGEPDPSGDRSPLLNHHAFPVNAPRDSVFLEDFTDTNNTAPDTPFDGTTLDPEQLRRIDHGRTTDIMHRLGYPEPAAAARTNAARLRQDTLRRQADPATRHYLDEALRRLRQSSGPSGEQPDGWSG